MGASSQDARGSAAAAYFSHVAFKKIGASGLDPFPAAVAHGVVGGISSELQGGKFGHGFFSAGITKYANVNAIMSDDAGTYADFVRVTTAAVIGGSVSRLTAAVVTRTKSA